MEKHIVIAGKRKMGKTTLVNRLIAVCDKPIYGFITDYGKSLRPGYRSFFMHPAGITERFESEANHIGDGNGVNHYKYPDTFDNYGVQCLEAKPDGIIVMDELGFMELDAHKFCNKVLELLDGDIPVIATAKAGHDCDFLNSILEHPNAKVFYIDQENRDSIYEEIRKYMDETHFCE